MDLRSGWPEEEGPFPFPPLPLLSVLSLHTARAKGYEGRCLCVVIEYLILNTGWKGFVIHCGKFPHSFTWGPRWGISFLGILLITSNFRTHWNIVALLLDLEVDFGKCNFYAVQFGCVALDSISSPRQVLFRPLPSSTPELEMPYL